MLTLLCYLNRDWQKGDGGELRLFVKKKFLDESVSAEHADELETVDVEPRFGTVVLFQSHLIPHEVLEVHRGHRDAITVWFYEESDDSRQNEETETK